MMKVIMSKYFMYGWGYYLTCLVRAIFGDFLADLDFVGVDVVKWNREGDEIGEGGKLYLYTVGQGPRNQLGTQNKE